MKAYTFINSYVCGIQVGIQAGHAIVELMDNWANHKDVAEWARHHKTFVWLDGGDSDNMQEILNTIVKADVAYEFFLEPGLGNVTTAITVVPNAELVELANQVRQWRYRLLPDNPIPGFYDDKGQLQINIASKGISLGEACLVELIANSRNKNL